MLKEQCHVASKPLDGSFTYVVGFNGAVVQEEELNSMMCCFHP